MRTVGLILVGLVVSGCISRSEIQATVWLNNAPIPPALCDQSPELKNYGFYRRLNTGKIEFVSFCSPLANRWISAFDDDFNRILDDTIPKSSE